VPDASKAAFVVLVEQLRGWGITLLDSQVHTEHVARFGATEWPRREYLRALREALRRPTRKGGWRFDEGKPARRSTA
jgi:leucyl/phenylalanyl-tRNA--protein transferase